MVVKFKSQKKYNMSKSYVRSKNVSNGFISVMILEECTYLLQVKRYRHRLSQRCSSYYRRILIMNDPKKRYLSISLATH